MTYEEANEILDILNSKLGNELVIVFRLVKEAVNLQVSKLPENLNEDTWSCPRCGKQYETEEENNYYYCPNCGQAIDWSMYEEDA